MNTTTTMTAEITLSPAIEAIIDNMATAQSVSEFDAHYYILGKAVVTLAQIADWVLLSGWSEGRIINEIIGFGEDVAAAHLATNV